MSNTAIGACPECNGTRWVFTIEYTAIFDAETRLVEQKSLGWDENIRPEDGMSCESCGYAMPFPVKPGHPEWGEMNRALGATVEFDAWRERMQQVCLEHAKQRDRHWEMVRRGEAAESMRVGDSPALGVRVPGFPEWLKANGHQSVRTTYLSVVLGSGMIQAPPVTPEARQRMDALFQEFRREETQSEASE